MKLTERDISSLVKDKISLLKHGKKLQIKIIFRKIRYYLVLVTDNQRTDKKIIKLLALWRKKHEQWFPAIFPVTLEGTEKWLRDKVVNEPDRILFMIKVKNRYIGHIGLYRFNFQKRICEIDNIVRGVNLYPGIIEDAIRHMICWGRVEFGIKTYMLSTTSDNIRAIRLYRKLDFTEVKRTPMIRIVKSDRIEWQNAPKGYKGTIKRYSVVMKLPYEKI